MHGADSEVSACFESHHRFYFLFREPLQLDTRHKVTLPARSLFCLAFLPCFTPRSSRTGARACPWVGSVPASCGPGPGHADTSGRQVTQHGPGFNIHCVRLQPCATHFCLKTMHAAHTPSYSMEEPAMIVSRPGGPPRCGRSTCAAWRSRRPPPARGENQMTRAKSISTSLQAADTAGGRAAEASLLNTNNTLSFLAFAPARAPWRGG